MSNYSLVQRGVIQITSADGASPKTDTLASAIKTASAFVVSSVKDVRCRKFVQRGIESIVNPNTSPRTVNLGTQVDPACAHVVLSFHEVQTGTSSGVRGRLINSGADLELVFTNPAAGDSIQVAWEVIEEKVPSGVNVRITDPTTVEVSWDGGALAAGEIIDVAYEVFDIENLGDDVKELLFRAERVLAYLGENVLQDNITYDDAGNMTSYRLRSFDSKANAEAATVDAPGGLEAGERARITVTQPIDVAKNDRTSLLRVLTDLLPTPGVN